MSHRRTYGTAHMCALEEKQEKEKKNGRKKQKWKAKILRGGPHGHTGDYAAELGPLLLLGRRSETGAGWLGDAEIFVFSGIPCDSTML